MERTNNDYFKMGAVVAVGELYDQELITKSEEAAYNIRAFLRSFGVTGIQDMRDLGMGDHYLRDFREVFASQAEQRAQNVKQPHQQFGLHCEAQA